MNKNKQQWRKDKNSEKYKRYLRKRKKAMEEAHRERLEKLNKIPPLTTQKVDSNKGQV